MTSSERLAIGFSPERPVIELGDTSISVADCGPEEPADAAIWTFLASLPSMADAWLLKEVQSTRLMEVRIDGDLIRSSDGGGFRAFAIGEDGIREHARLFDVDALTNIIQITAVWRIASVLVAQKHLSDINVTLRALNRKVDEVLAMQRASLTSAIEAEFGYLQGAAFSILSGEMSEAVRMRLEIADVEMEKVQRNLEKVVERYAPEKPLSRRADLKVLESALQPIEKCIREHRAAAATRTAALTLLSAYSNTANLRNQRQNAIDAASIRMSSLRVGVYERLSSHVEKWDSPAERMTRSFKALAVKTLRGAVLVADEKLERQKKHAIKSDVAEKAFKDLARHATAGADQLEDLLKPDEPLAFERLKLCATERLLSLRDDCSTGAQAVESSAISYRVEWEDGRPTSVRPIKGAHGWHQSASALP